MFLRERAAGQVIARADSAAISVLKTYQPDLTALRGRVIDGVQRHGKFLDLIAVRPTASRQLARCTWSSTWPAPGGCAGGRTCPPPRPSRAKARLASGSGSPTAPAST